MDFRQSERALQERVDSGPADLVRFLVMLVWPPALLARLGLAFLRTGRWLVRLARPAG
jgi:hypothetical protein